MVKTKYNFRAQELLGILKMYGPLSFKTISQIVDPPMKEKKLRAALQRLLKGNFIVKRNEKIFGGRGTHYQISQYENDRFRASQILGCSSQELEQPEFRNRELLHNNMCALWMHKFKQLLPSAVCVRDFEFSSHAYSQMIVSNHNYDSDLKPDLLLIFKTSGDKKLTSIAVEIERTQKSNKRLQLKLYKYANETYVDGVIYICETKRIKEALMQIYKDKIAFKAKRIENYPEYFFLFLESSSNQNLNDIYLHSFNQTFVSLVDWTHYLINTEFNKRRNLAITTMGESPSP